MKSWKFSSLDNKKHPRDDKNPETLDNLKSPENLKDLEHFEFLGDLESLECLGALEHIEFIGDVENLKNRRVALGKVTQHRNGDGSGSWCRVCSAADIGFINPEVRGMLRHKRDKDRRERR